MSDLKARLKQVLEKSSGTVLFRNTDAVRILQLAIIGEKHEKAEKKRRAKK